MMWEREPDWYYAPVLLHNALTFCIFSFLIMCIMQHSSVTGAVFIVFWIAEEWKDMVSIPICFSFDHPIPILTRTIATTLSHPNKPSVDKGCATLLVICIMSLPAASHHVVGHCRIFSSSASSWWWLHHVVGGCVLLSGHASESFGSYK